VFTYETDQLAKAAASLIERVGWDAVRAHMPGGGRVEVQPPAPGVAVLACRCGRSLDAGDMRWAPPAPDDVFRPIPAIVCGVCRNSALAIHSALVEGWR
jgi:hypothetical protein